MVRKDRETVPRCTPHTQLYHTRLSNRQTYVACSDLVQITARRNAHCMCAKSRHAARVRLLDKPVWTVAGLQDEIPRSKRVAGFKAQT